MLFSNRKLIRRLMWVSGMLIFSIIFVSCGNVSRYPGYAITDSGIHFQLLKLGEEDWKFSPGDYYTADIEYRTLNDSVFFKGRRKLQIFEPEFEGAIEECFAMLHPGDSAIFIISADSFFVRTIEAEMPSFLPANSEMKVCISVIEAQNLQQYAKEKDAFLSWISDFEAYENVMLSQFIENENVKSLPFADGLYCIPIEEGSDVKIQRGDTITIHYEGWFLNGTFFDSTRKRNQPFSFVYGTEWQVVKGIEDALRSMSEGEKSVFIMPSRLAFGYTGSSTGIIPPFTTVIFEIEVLKVGKAAKNIK